jgi:hypothetical protein
LVTWLWEAGEEVEVYPGKEISNSFLTNIDFSSVPGADRHNPISSDLLDGLEFHAVHHKPIPSD